MTDKQNIPAEFKPLIEVMLDDVLSPPCYAEISSQTKKNYEEYGFLFIILIPMILSGLYLLSEILGEKRISFAGYISGLTALSGVIGLIAFLIISEKKARNILTVQNNDALKPELEKIFYNNQSNDEPVLNTTKIVKNKNRFWITWFLLSVNIFLWVMVYATEPFLEYYELRNYIQILACIVSTLLLLSVIMNLSSNNKTTYSAQDIQIRNTSLSYFKKDILALVPDNEIVIDAITVKPTGEVASILLMTNKNIYKFVDKTISKGAIASILKDSNDDAYPLNISTISNVETIKPSLEIFTFLSFETSSGSKIVEKILNNFEANKFKDKILSIQKRNQ